MDTNYRVIITPTAYKEINLIYDYISKELYAEKAAKELMRQSRKKTTETKIFP